MYKLLFVLPFLAFISCKNTYVDNSINQTYAELTNVSVSDSISYSHKSDYTLKVPIQYFGENLDSEKKIKVKISNTNFNNSLIKYDSIFTIKPKKYKDSLGITFCTSKLSLNQKYNLKISIDSENNDIKISNNNSECLVSIYKQSFAGFYTGEYSCSETSTNSTYKTYFELVNQTSIKNMNFWDFPSEGQGLIYEFNESDSSVSIPRAEWVDNLENIYFVSGTGKYNTDGSFWVDFLMETADGEVYQTGRHKFTR